MRKDEKIRGNKTRREVRWEKKEIKEVIKQEEMR